MSSIDICKTINIRGFKFVNAASPFIKAFGGHNRNFDFGVKAPAGADLNEYEYEVIGEMRKIRRLEPGDGLSRRPARRLGDHPWAKPLGKRCRA